MTKNGWHKPHKRAELMKAWAERPEIQGCLQECNAALRTWLDVEVVKKIGAELSRRDGETHDIKKAEVSK